MKRYKSNTLSHYSQRCMKGFHWVLQILISTQICPISHHTLTVYSTTLKYIKCCNSANWRDINLILYLIIHRDVWKVFNEFCKFWYLRTQICLISHHTLIVYSSNLKYIKCCNSAKWRDINLTLYISLFTEMYERFSLSCANFDISVLKFALSLTTH